MNIQITRSSELDASPVAAFAVEELKTFLEPFATVTIAKAATSAAQPGKRYVLRQIGGLVPSLMHGEPHGFPD